MCYLVVLYLALITANVQLFVGAFVVVKIFFMAGFGLALFVLDKIRIKLIFGSINLSIVNQVGIC